MAKKPQTEEKAKGLVKGVGNYKGKTLNLSKKQLGAGGVKAAKARKVDISSTRWDKASRKVLGPKGQPLTGRVDLGGGNIAVYKNGVRVRAGGGGNGQKKQTGPRNTSTSTSYKPSAAAVKAGAGKRYEERKPSVGAVAARSRKTPGENYRGKPDRIDKPANVAQSVWERMSMAQKAALVGGLVLPVTRIPAIIASGGIAGNYVGTAIKNARNRGKTTKKPTRPLKMTKTYPGGR